MADSNATTEPCAWRAGIGLHRILWREVREMIVEALEIEASEGPGSALARGC
jgi:hypothetical protein